MKRIGIIVLALFWSSCAWSLTLEEYGITPTDNGLIDNVSGLRWLDSALTQGGYAELQAFFDAGWRLASEEELYFLLTHSSTSIFSGASTRLGEDGLLQIADRLSFAFGNVGLFLNPWVCRAYDDPEQYCTILNEPGSIAGLGGQFGLEMGDEYQDGDDTLIPIFMYPYITEVPIYGSLVCYEDPTVPCIGEGRSLLVRAVPLPASVFLLTGALGMFGLFRRTTQ